MLVTGDTLLQCESVQHLPAEQRQNLTSLLLTYRRQQKLARRLANGDDPSSKSSPAYEERVALANKMKANMHVKEPLSAVISYNVEGSPKSTDDGVSRSSESCQKCTTKLFRYCFFFQTVYLTER